MPVNRKSRAEERFMVSTVPGPASHEGDAERKVVWCDDVKEDAWHSDSRIAPADALSDLPTEDGGAGDRDAPATESEYATGDEDDDDQDDEATDSVDEDSESSRGHGEGDGELETDSPGSTSGRGRRSKTIARKQMLRERRRMLAQGTLPEILDYERPVTRAECRSAKRPCLYVSCRYHLYLDVNPVTGSIKINFPDREIWDLEETCALDVAERGGITLEEVGEIMNLTRERIRQVEVSGLDKLRVGDAELHTFIDGRELQISGRKTGGILPIIDD